MQINIRSFEQVFGEVYQVVSNAFDDKTDLIWSFNKKQRLLDTKQFMMSLIENVDLILIRQCQWLSYRNETADVLAVIKNNDDLSDPFLLIALNDKGRTCFRGIEKDQRSEYGKVNIVGFGPGDPDLLTVKALSLLREADVIFYDDLLDQNYLDQFSAERFYVGKRKGRHYTPQEEINQLLFESAIKGKTVVRLKGGDPLIFGRGGEEYDYLKRRNVEAEIIPGITSALAAAADFAIPLTSRGKSSSVAFALGHDAIYNKLPKADTLVFYMGASQQQDWARRLLKEGWPADTPVASVRNASRKDKEIKRYRLQDLQSSDDLLKAPALLIVGETAGEDTFKDVRKWLYTGIDLEYFKEKGRVVHNPMEEVSGLPLNEKQRQIVHHLNAFDRIVFASLFAVDEFFRAINDLGYDVRALLSLEITSLGQSTSMALKKYGLKVLPATLFNSAEDLLIDFSNKGISGESILLPCSEAGLSVLPDGLQQLGNHVEAFKLYELKRPGNAVRHNLDEFYGVFLSSPTAVHHFFQFYQNIPLSLTFKVRGKYTNEVLNSYLEQLKIRKYVTVDKWRA